VRIVESRTSELFLQLVNMRSQIMRRVVGRRGEDPTT
jgi:hypothetical protein